MTFLPKARDFSIGEIMKIILDEVRKEGVLVKKDGTEISRYSYKNLLDKNFTLEELRKDIEGFNVTLGQQEEFDDIRKLADYIKIHSW